MAKIRYKRTYVYFDLPALMGGGDYCIMVWSMGSLSRSYDAVFMVFWPSMGYLRSSDTHSDDRNAAMSAWRRTLDLFKLVAAT